MFDGVWLGVRSVSLDLDQHIWLLMMLLCSVVRRRLDWQEALIGGDLVTWAQFSHPIGGWQTGDRSNFPAWLHPTPGGLALDRYRWKCVSYPLSSHIFIIYSLIQCVFSSLFILWVRRIYNVWKRIYTHICLYFISLSCNIYNLPTVNSGAVRLDKFS